MKENDLLLINGEIYRLLNLSDSKALVINCLKKKMPYQIDFELLGSPEMISQEQLLEHAHIIFPDYDNITPNRRKSIHEKYGTISLILPYINNEAERNSAIEICAQRFGLSKATIRSRLCDYLAFQDVRIFLGNQKSTQKPLSHNEKNFRWALNKYYYKAIKIPLKEAYRRMLKDKYCDANGMLFPEIPSFRQFSYYFHKTVSKENLIISRDGKGNFLRNHRAMLGNGIRDFCPTIGYGMLDSTICDIFLINDKGKLLGRPILTACVDGYSSMCLGYYLGFSGGVYSLNKLLKNICADRQKHCQRFGIEIEKADWNCTQLPHKLITDKGKEYVSETFSQITDLGVEIVNLPPYRPDLKSAVEKFFDVVQGYYKKDLASKGVIFEDYQERGGKDYRKNATFTLKEFEKILLLCIIKYNTKRLIDLPYTHIDKVQPFANELWNSCLLQYRDNLINATEQQLEFVLLPRTQGIFKRNGLIANGLRYKNLNYTEKYLNGGEATVAYDPHNVSRVWVIEKDTYEEFEIIEEFFTDMNLEKANRLKQQKYSIKNAAQKVALQASIDLSRELECIAMSRLSSNPRLENIRQNRKTEKFMEEYCE